MGNIFLIGFMGVGKTSVAEQLSRMTGRKNVDMDQMIAEQQKLSIPEIFAQYGEEYFRKLETNLLKELPLVDQGIISCGGGVVMKEHNVSEMKKKGTVILLTATPDTIYQRLKADEGRPLLKGRNHIEGISELMEVRRERYEAAADVVIATDYKAVEEICKEIINKI